MQSFSARIPSGSNSRSFKQRLPKIIRSGSFFSNDDLSGRVIKAPLSLKRKRHVIDPQTTHKEVATTTNTKRLCQTLLSKMPKLAARLSEAHVEIPCTAKEGGYHN